MIIIKRPTYTLLLGDNPCEIFTYYGVEEMHGVSLKECEEYNNTKDDAYIWGLANFVPKANKEYCQADAKFVFINLQRCSNNRETFGGVFHEIMHHSLHIHNYNMDLEEEIISWAEIEAHDVFKLILEELIK